MARLLIWSDLHDEHWRGFDLLDPAALGGPIDAVLIGGDTNTGGRHLAIPARAARALGCPVIVVWGNHEPYDAIWQDLRDREGDELARLRAGGLNLRVLHGEATVIEAADGPPLRVIGATLWTDLVLYPGHEALARRVLPRRLLDYHAIRVRGDEGARRGIDGGAEDHGADAPPAPARSLTVDDVLRWHQADRAAVLEHLARPFAGPTVVLTHHLPVREMVHPRWDRGPMAERVVTAGFASDLWAAIRPHPVALWACGHSHDARNWTAPGAHGPVRFVANPRGYPREGCAFDPAMVVEV